MENEEKGVELQSRRQEEEEEEEEMMMMEMELRRGPWTVEEDLNLINFIAKQGEGRWNSLARSSGLRRTGKSCRLRWLNYLRPDVRRGNITFEEQLLILELHSRWGNRWSKIAQYLPGRTDNEIKNYWRTRVQKHAKQLKCDVNSKQFKDTMCYLWMPRLVERIHAAASTTLIPTSYTAATTSANFQFNHSNFYISGGDIITTPETNCGTGYTSENSSTATSSDSFRTPPMSDLITENYYPVINNNTTTNNNEDYNCLFDNSNCYYPGSHSDTLISPCGYYTAPGTDTQPMKQSNDPYLFNDGFTSDTSMWNVEDICFLKQQLIIDNTPAN